MKKQLQQLIEWHKKYGVYYNEKPQYFIPEKVVKLRERIMKEEVREWASAAENQCLRQDRAKELADILYTVLGTIIAEGFQDYIEQIFDSVHESNMSKGTNGKPVIREDGKILKGEDYKEPDLKWLEEELCRIG